MSNVVYTLVRVTEYVCPKRNRVRVVYMVVWTSRSGSARGACSGFYFFLHLPSEASSDDFIVHFSSFLFSAWG